MKTVSGITASYWQAGIDWPKVRSTGQRFVFVQATIGISYSDPTFKNNWVGAKSSGFLRAAFHVFRTSVDPKKQAEKYIEYVKILDDDGEFPPVLVLESNDGQTNAILIERVKTWLDLAEEAFGKKPIICSNQFFLHDYFTDAEGKPPVWVNNYPLWLVQFPITYVDGLQPFMPHGWLRWTFWQYSEKGNLNGINGNVGMNHFNGTLEDLYKLTGVKMVAKGPQEHIVVAGDSYESIANKYGVTVRELISANLHLLKLGDVLKVPSIWFTVPHIGESETVSELPRKEDDPPRITHTVELGDTLYMIAIRYNITVEAIAMANNIPNVNDISVGDVLVIPQTEMN